MIRNNTIGMLADTSRLRIPIKRSTISKKVYLFLGLLLSMLFLGALSAEAANHYVRAGASGSNNGSDWNNAYAGIPSTLVRGDTYYIAGGNYGSYTFNTATSGSLYIYIVGATSANSGTVAGWNSNYDVATNSATFTGSPAVFTIATQYISIDGQVGSGNQTDTHYGIVLNMTTLGQAPSQNPSGESISGAVLIPSGGNRSHMILKHIFMSCPVTGSVGSISLAAGAFCLNDQTWASTDQLIQYNKIQGGQIGVEITGQGTGTTGGWTVFDHNHVLNSGNIPHSALMNIPNAQYAVISNNIFENCLWQCTTYIEPQQNGYQAPNHIYIYGNIFWNNPASYPAGVNEGTTNTAVFSVTSCELSDNTYLFNNTAYGLSKNNTANAGGSMNNSGVMFDESSLGCSAQSENGGRTASANAVVMNNLWQNNQYSPSLIGVTTSSNNILNTSGGASFANASSGNFNLTAHTATGTSSIPGLPSNLPIPYNVDPNGNNRNTSQWDIGAFEFGSTQGVPPPVTRPNPPLLH